MSSPDSISLPLDYMFDLISLIIEMIFQNENEENFNLLGKEHVQLLNCKI